MFVVPPVYAFPAMAKVYELDSFGKNKDKITFKVQCTQTFCSQENKLWRHSLSRQYLVPFVCKTLADWAKFNIFVTVSKREASSKSIHCPLLLPIGLFHSRHFNMSQWGK